MARQNDAFPSKFVKAVTLLDANGDPMSPVVTIKSMKTVRYPDGGQQRAAVFDLSGDQTDMELGLNKTNWKSCALIAGLDPEVCDDESFVGLEIQLVYKMVEFKANMVPSVRVQPIGGWEGWKPSAAAAAAMANDATKENDELPF